MHEFWDRKKTDNKMSVRDGLAKHINAMQKRENWSWNRWTTVETI